MPRAFLVLNKKTKSKHRKNTLDDEEDHSLKTDENQNFHEDIRNDRSGESFVEIVKTDEETENEEDIEIDVEGPCSVHSELILPHHSNERDSVTSLSPRSTNSLQNYGSIEHNTSYISHGSTSSNPSSPSQAYSGFDTNFKATDTDIKGKLH